MISLPIRCLQIIFASCEVADGCSLALTCKFLYFVYRMPATKAKMFDVLRKRIECLNSCLEDESRNKTHAQLDLIHRKLDYDRERKEMLMEIKRSGNVFNVKYASVGDFVIYLDKSKVQKPGKICKILKNSIQVQFPDHTIIFKKDSLCKFVYA